MKKLIFILAVIMFLSGCAATSDKFQFQMRMDSFYRILNTNELAAFQKGDYDAFSNSIDSRLSNESRLLKAFSAIQENEAITTFNSYQTAHFFREIILRELNRENYYRMMKFLDATNQEAFAKKDNFQPKFDSLYKSNSSFKSFVDSLRYDSRLNGFSNEEIADFFRNVSFPETSRKELYHLLSCWWKLTVIMIF